MFDEISFLVQETFKDAEKFGANILSQIRKDIPRNCPGIFFNLQKNSSTFVIRIHVSKNLSDDYKSILKHPDMYPSLRLDREGEGSLEEQISFFECESFAIAGLVKEQLSNKRFPINEENIFNISDPGDSWWMKADANQVGVHFSLSNVEKLNSYIKLGPLGEPQRCSDIFGKLFGYFKQIFPIDNYVSSFNEFSMSTSDEQSLLFKNFKDMLVMGDIDPELWRHLKALENNSSSDEIRDSFQKANSFILEIGTIRKFWKLIESKL